MSPGGVGFDINCGVRLLRTNLTEDQVQPVKEQLAQVWGYVGGRGVGVLVFFLLLMLLCHTGCTTLILLARASSCQLCPFPPVPAFCPPVLCRLRHCHCFTPPTQTPPHTHTIHPQSLFDHIPVGVGSQGIIPTTAKDLEAALEMGMDWSLRWVRGCWVGCCWGGCCVDVWGCCCCLLVPQHWHTGSAMWESGMD